MSQHKNDIYQMAADLKEFAEHFKIKMSYIYEQTGIPEKKIKRFFDLSEEGVSESEYSEYREIGEAIDKLFRTERHSDHHWQMDDAEFYEIHQKLRTEFGLKNGLQVALIKEKVQAIFDKRQVDDTVGFLDYCISLFGIDRTQEMIEDNSYREYYSDYCRYKDPYYNPNYNYKSRQEKSFQKIDNHTISKVDFTFNADQQRAILEMYFDACTDDNGYLLPNHFGSGIQLSELVEEEFTFISKQGTKSKGWASIRGIKKATSWATAENLKKYNYGDKLPETDKSDPIYQFIAGHKRVFFHDTSFKYMSDVLERITDSPNKVTEQVLDLLEDTFRIVKPKSEKACEYYKTVSEYFDILSLRPPVTDLSEYSKERIYRIVYEISAESDGAITFSNELVDQIFRLIKLNTEKWAWRMYISYYYFKHKEINSLIRYIAEKNRKYRNIDEKSSL